MRVLRHRIALLVVCCAAPVVAQAQGITRDNYYAMIPPKPRIVGQTAASVALHLFGDARDSAYRDADPVDGIDDRRAQRLLELAERFSPILRRNNASVPRDPADILGPDPLLHVDSWQNGRRIRSDSIALGPSIAQAGETGAARNTMAEPDVDRRLAAIIDAVGPHAPSLAVAKPDDDVDYVLFFDMPGHDPKSWRAAVDDLSSRRSRVFAHPFLREARDASGGARYQLVLQYWFFYPLNNSVNNHEGDWEHVNVIVTTVTRAAAAQPRVYTSALLSADDVARLLSPSFPIADSTTIAAVDYYYHHHVLTLDYVARQMVPNEEDKLRHDHGPRYVWEDVGFASRAVDRSLTLARGRLATHALVFIGGDHKGPAELLAIVPRFGASFGRNSHGSYPFPGTWQTVGPLGMTEQVHGELTPALREAPDTPWDSLITDRRYHAYRAADIMLLPDWERVESLMASNVDVRRRWAWMILPIHWGFPAVESLGAGMLEHVNLGNVAPLAPPYQSTWNRAGSAAGRSRQSPRVLQTPISPTTPWAVLRNGWGILNAPLAVWGLMPGYNVALLELMPWTAGALHILGAPPARTYTAAALPHRFSTEGQGVFWEFGGSDFAAMLPRDDAANAALGATIDETSLWRRSRPGPRLGLSIFFRDRFALENTYSWQQSTIGYDLIDTQGKRAGSVTAALEMRQLTGGVRYSPYSAFDEAIQLYLRAGYGWLWYEASDPRLASANIAAPPRGGYLPPILPSRRWWPNTWYSGAGLELFSPREVWLFERLGYGLRLDGALYANRLSFDYASARRGATAVRGDLAVSLIFGW